MTRQTESRPDVPSPVTFDVDIEGVSVVERYNGSLIVVDGKVLSGRLPPPGTVVNVYEHEVLVATAVIASGPGTDVPPPHVIFALKNVGVTQLRPGVRIRAAPATQSARPSAG
jgi:hypothetical protein